MKISAIVLTRNEERNIKDCLASLSWADEMLVVDSGSTDGTRVLAEKQGARVVTHPFTNFSAQRNFAMSQVTGEWVLFIDADERVTPELAGEMTEVLKGSAPLGVYAIPRHNYFFCKRLRFGDSREDAPVRFFPRQHVTWSQPVHEVIATDLPVQKLRSPLLHYSTCDLAHYQQKIREYVPLELEMMRAKGLRPSFLKAIFIPPLKFIQLYFCRLGIFDGLVGFQYALLSAYCSFSKYWRYFISTNDLRRDEAR